MEEKIAEEEKKLYSNVEEEVKKTHENAADKLLSNEVSIFS